MTLAGQLITVQSATLPVLGTVDVAVTGLGVCALALRSWDDHDLRLRSWEAAGYLVRRGRHAHGEQALDALTAYATRTSTSLTMPLDLRYLPDFTQRVLTALLAVPHGQVITYGGLAQQAGSPRAARAVGGAVGRNPIPVIVPCHRVVAGNGIGGFGLGLACKRALLDLEGVVIAG
jgi:methylated-DNA-[protein]-cysteine S-methyltransferase